jgi:hypothetical protein
MAPSDSTPSKNDEGYFTDAGDLTAPTDRMTGPELAALFKSLLRADLGGTRAGAVLQAFEQARGAFRELLAYALNDAFNEDSALLKWIEESEERRRKAEQIALRVAGEDPSRRHNVAVYAALRDFKDWGSYLHHVIIVPGYTPLDAKVATPGVHAITRRRLDVALAGFNAKKAPFVLVTGSNVYPRGTPYYEGIEMKKELLSMGMPEDRILVEARARHSTTNLRNAARHMVQHGMRIGLITTVGGGVGGSDVFDQDFYLSNPTMSTFHARCERELGYKVGELRGIETAHIEFIPSPSCRKIGYRDVLDP